MSRGTWTVVPPDRDALVYAGVTRREAEQSARRDLGVSRLPTGTDVHQAGETAAAARALVDRLYPESVYAVRPDVTGFAIYNVETGRVRGHRSTSAEAEVVARAWSDGRPGPRASDSTWAGVGA